MVTFKLIFNDGKIAIYWYFPEGKEENGHGVIIVNQVEHTIKIETLAPDDFQREEPAENLNRLRDEINAMMLENEEPPLTEEELPTATEPMIITFFADHVIKNIREEIKETGTLPKTGMSAWY